MREIKSLCDALLKTHVQEDQCTNFLLWTLRSIPIGCLHEVCRASGLALEENPDPYGFYAQLSLESSRPDGYIHLSRDEHLIIETKRFPDALDEAQFENHITGAGKEYKLRNCFFLFISGDRKEPLAISKWHALYPGRIGFISWLGLLALFSDLKPQLDAPYAALLREFEIFARYNQLGQLMKISTEETNAFLAAYPTVALYQRAAVERFSKAIRRITERVICNCEELVTLAGELITELPCPYQPLHVKGWHLPGDSAFIFLDIRARQIGLIANGYQNEKEKRDFLPLWEKRLKQLFREDTRLQAFTWIDKDEEDTLADYFKLVPGTSGKSFNPDVLDVFDNYFYWGYLYPLEVEKLDEPFFHTIAADAKELFRKFRSGGELDEIR